MQKLPQENLLKEFALYFKDSEVSLIKNIEKSWRHQQSKWYDLVFYVLMVQQNVRKFENVVFVYQSFNPKQHLVYSLSDILGNLKIFKQMTVWANVTK